MTELQRLFGAHLSTCNAKSSDSKHGHKCQLATDHIGAHSASWYGGDGGGSVWVDSILSVPNQSKMDEL